MKVCVSSRVSALVFPLIWFPFLKTSVVAPGWWLAVVSSPSLSNPLLPGCLHLGVFTSTSKTTCAKSFPIFSHETTLLLGFLSALVAQKAQRLETVSYPVHPLPYSSSFGIREQLQMPSRAAWPCPESSGHRRCLPVWLHDKCLLEDYSVFEPMVSYRILSTSHSL